MANILAILEVSRIRNSMAIGVLFAGVALASGALSYAAIVAGALSWTCAAAAAYSLNDRVDVAIDRVNHPERPLPSGRMSPLQCTLVIHAWLVAALIAAASWTNGLRWIII